MPEQLDRCVQDVLAHGDVKEYPGRTKEESAYAICQSSLAHKSFGGALTKELVTEMQLSRWPEIAKAARGGLDHVVSVDIPIASQTSKAGADNKNNPMSHYTSPDNGSYYAELWSRGGNWYAVTGAGIHQIEGVNKGMTVYDVVPRFLAALNKASCAPCAAAAASR